MNGTMSDADVRLLASISNTMRDEYVQDLEAWKDSPFAWILTQPSRRKGAIFESLVSKWCIARKLRVTRSGDSDADRIVEGLRVEIKGSTAPSTFIAGRFQRRKSCAVGETGIFLRNMGAGQAPIRHGSTSNRPVLRGGCGSGAAGSRRRMTS